ncbi:MAG: exosortase/archaeosortase family protein [Candidatus Bathyarchaeia archaeon]
MKKYWFHVTLIALYCLPIILLLFLDYYNIEGYNYVYNPATQDFERWDPCNVFFNQNFVFETTWKGRMFYLFFIWLIFIESIIYWNELGDAKPKKYFTIIASLVFALVPTVYVIAINYFGLDLAVLKAGFNFGIRAITLEGRPWDFLYLQWPLSCEYIVLAVFFISAAILAYGLKGLKFFSISFVLIAGIGAAYMFDTIYPFGVFKPLQAFALPTAATAAAILDLLGYKTILNFQNFPVYSSTTNSYLPRLIIWNGKTYAAADIGWACSGVHSLLLYVLIILVFFKRTEISSFRKLAYFVIGFIGTYFVNVLRICSYLLIYLYQGEVAADTFHDSYGELYFFMWIFAYIALITSIQRFMLVERAKNALNNARTKFSSWFKLMKQKIKFEIGRKT